ncbi:putative quinol monooxygenase [Lentibacillus amyloliquefaciens]|uniref:Monooxygenase n=1 Tax=Lentibacillus amyloliquefaciens TaxID=1472767 RepID=A0A0U4FM01_9BACI|nr:putative quinol monooxygenase [Lentibacillus amyloliquefaciens]ALX48772.1 monooxygenase [Lentibacillus amyloliquefaciens]
MTNIVVTAVFKPKQDQTQTLIQELKKVKIASREEKGCIQYDLHQSMEDDTLLIYEVWEDEEAVQEHIVTDHYKTYRENTEDLIESRVVSKYKKI